MAESDLGPGDERLVERVVDDHDPGGGERGQFVEQVQDARPSGDGAELLGDVPGPGCHPGTEAAGADDHLGDRPGGHGRAAAW